MMIVGLILIPFYVVCPDVELVAMRRYLMGESRLDLKTFAVVE